MHESAYVKMGELLWHHLGDRWDKVLHVLDVGSKCIAPETRTYRELCSAAWRYTGSDLEAGENVDRVQAGPYHIQDKAEQYDLVLCGQVLEHSEQPWVLVPEMTRMVKPGGWMFLTAPWYWHIHRYPVDCWRILPDGMRVLLELAGLKIVDVNHSNTDTWGIARKQAKTP